MVSRLVRRSGIAVCGMCELLDWVPDAFIQVGIGVFCKEVDVVVECWPGLKIIGIEPCADTIKNLKGAYPGEVHEYAITNWIGQTSFYVKRNHKDGSTIFPRKADKPEKKVKEVIVNTTTLDTLFPDPDSVGKKILLWLDCEGCELLALKGGKKLLKNVDVINVELTSDPVGEGWCDMMETHHWLVKNGYKRQAAHTQRSSAGQCDAIYVKNHLWKAQHCACPCSF